jgi:hypothetical protein
MGRRSLGRIVKAQLLRPRRARTANSMPMCSNEAPAKEDPDLTGARGRMGQVGAVKGWPWMGPSNANGAL